MLRRLLSRKVSTPAAPAKANSADEINARLDVLGREWMYAFDFGHGVSLPAYNEYLAESHAVRWRMIEPELQREFGACWHDTRVLDVACNEGWWSAQVAGLGAKHVVGFDARIANINRAQFMKTQRDLANVEFRVDDITRVDTAAYGAFDLTLCLGLLYHLEDPMGALRKLRALTHGLLVIETEVARPGSITIDRGPVDGTVTTEHLLAVVPEPYYEHNLLASVTGLSIVPTLATLEYMLTLAGFRDMAIVQPIADGTVRHQAGDRVVMLARV